MILTGRPTHTAWIGGTSAPSPRSSALAWKASVVSGPPVIWAQRMAKGSRRSQPLCWNTHWVTGSPTIKVTPAGVRSGSGSDRAAASVFAALRLGAKANSKATLAATKAARTAHCRPEVLTARGMFSPGR